MSWLTEELTNRNMERNEKVQGMKSQMFTYSSWYCIKMKINMKYCVCIHLFFLYMMHRNMRQFFFVSSTKMWRLRYCTELKDGKYLIHKRFEIFCKEKKIFRENLPSTSKVNSCIKPNSAPV